MKLTKAIKLGAIAATLLTLSIPSFAQFFQYWDVEHNGTIEAAKAVSYLPSLYKDK